MVLFDAQHLVRTAFADRARNRSLCAHRIDRDHTALECELGQQFWNRGDFVGFLGCGSLTEHHAHFGGKGADHTQRTNGDFPLMPVRRLVLPSIATTVSSASAGTIMPTQRRNAHSNSSREHSEDPAERVVRRDAVLKLHETSQPVQLGFGPKLDIDEVVHAGKTDTVSNSARSWRL